MTLYMLLCLQIGASIVLHNFVSIFRSFDDVDLGIGDCPDVLDHHMHVSSFGTDAMCQLHFEKFKPLRCPVCNRRATPVYHCSHVERNQQQGRTWRHNSNLYVDARVDISEMLYDKVLTDNVDAVLTDNVDAGDTWRESRDEGSRCY